MHDRIDTAARILREARFAVALTGAGISTPSGIPDFRSKDTGLWARVDPLEVATLTAFIDQPERFFAWIRPLAALILCAQPNPAHRALADMERAGIIRAIITQNVDGLHQKSGSVNVAEVHGHVRQCTCVRCYRVESSEPYWQRLIERGETPRCPACGSVLKPNVTLFGEALPAPAVMVASQAMRRSDAILIVGSSLEVSPAADLPELARPNRPHIIIINQQPTHLDRDAAVVMHADAAEVVPSIAARLQLASV